jgi:hypothetical protein
VNRWVLLAYRLPREPSTPRIALWRKLRRLGAVQLIDGLVALPLDDQTRERLEWLADEVVEAGGSASVWLAEAGGAAHDRELVARMRERVNAEYATVVEAAAAARGRRALLRLRRALAQVEARDYFPGTEREQARLAVEELGKLVEAPR